MEKGKQNSQTVPVADSDSDSDQITSVMRDVGSGNLDHGHSDCVLDEFVIELDSDDELADEDFLNRNLLDADLEEWSRQVTRVLASNLIVASSDTDVVLAVRLGDEDGEGACIDSVRWTQIGGTRVDLGRVAGNERLVRVPDVLVEQDLIFEAEILSGSEWLVQEVAVRVQPASAKGVPTSDKHRRAGEPRGADTGQPVGKLWSVVRAFFGGKSAPRDEQ